MFPLMPTVPQRKSLKWAEMMFFRPPFQFTIQTQHLVSHQTLLRYSNAGLLKTGTVVFWVEPGEQAIFGV
jgi:hypothetical protein